MYPGNYQPQIRIWAQDGSNFASWMRHLGAQNPMPLAEVHHPVVMVVMEEEVVVMATKRWRRWRHRRGPHQVGMAVDGGDEAGRETVVMAQEKRSPVVIRR